jgi:hypothetical protein
MSYLDIKKTAYLNTLKQVNRMQKSSQHGVALVNIWCEICVKDKKKWQVRLCGSDALAHVGDNWVKETLKDSEFVMVCKDCIEKHKLISLRTERGAKWDGENLALFEIFEGNKKK